MIQSDQNIPFSKLNWGMPKWAKRQSFFFLYKGIGIAILAVHYFQVIKYEITFRFGFYNN